MPTFGTTSSYRTTRDRIPSNSATTSEGTTLEAVEATRVLLPSTRRAFERSSPSVRATNFACSACAFLTFLRQLSHSEKRQTLLAGIHECLPDRRRGLLLASCKQRRRQLRHTLSCTRSNLVWVWSTRCGWLRLSLVWSTNDIYLVASSDSSTPQAIAHSTEARENKLRLTTPQQLAGDVNEKKKRRGMLTFDSADLGAVPSAKRTRRMCHTTIRLSVLACVVHCTPLVTDRLCTRTELIFCTR